MGTDEVLYIIQSRNNRVPCGAPYGNLQHSRYTAVINLRLKSNPSRLRALVQRPDHSPFPIRADYQMLGYRRFGKEIADKCTKMRRRTRYSPCRGPYESQ